MATDKEDAQVRILKAIQSVELNKKWEGKTFAHAAKWKRSTVSDVMILQELEQVREENKTLTKQMNDMKKEQSEIFGLVHEMREVILGKNQERNTAEKEANSEPNQENRGGKQGPHTRSANDWNGQKGGSKKPKNTPPAYAPPGSHEYAETRNSNTDTNGDVRSGEEKKIKRVKSVLNADGTDIDKVPYEIPRSRYKPQKIPDMERNKLKAKDEEQKSREVIFCGIPSPASYLKDTPFETSGLVMDACDELKTKFLGNHYGINVKTTDIAFAQRQHGHVNKKFTPITVRFRRKETAENVIKAAKFTNILNKRGTVKFGKYREPDDYVNEKDEVIKSLPEVFERFKNRPGTFVKVSRTLEQQESDRAARDRRDTKSYKDRQKVVEFRKEQRISQAHFEALKIPEEDDSEEEHNAAQYGILPEPPEVTEKDDSFNTANDEVTPEEKKEAEATAKSKEAEAAAKLKREEDEKKAKETNKSQINKST